MRHYHLPCSLNPLLSLYFRTLFCVAHSNLQGGQKKKRTGDFLQNSQNIGPMNLKIDIHNLNTHSFQHLKYEFPNLKAF